MSEPLLAFAAGVLTVAAPCVLPLLPVVLGSSATAGQARARPLFIALGFALSFAAAALLFGAFQQVLGLAPEPVRDAGAVLLLVFGLLMVWPRPFQWLGVAGSGALNRVAALGDSAGNGNLGGLVLGMPLGVVWTPCAGPVLASILALIATQPDLGRAGLLLACYSLGAALPMLAIAYGGRAVFARVRGIVPYAHRLQQGLGVVVAGVAVATLLHYDGQLAAWLARWSPQQSTARADTAAGLHDYGRAPEFTGIVQWLNSEPLAMEQLRGKVVLVDFWTYSCANCLNTLPHVNRWAQTYRDQGLVVIGVHTPEFAFEKSTENVREAITRLGVRHAVAQDNRYATWKAYDNRYWPATYLIDARGHIRYKHFGEGDYARTEAAIRALLEPP